MAEGNHPSWQHVKRAVVNEVPDSSNGKPDHNDCAERHHDPQRNPDSHRYLFSP